MINIDKTVTYKAGGFMFKNYVNLTEKESRQILEWRNNEAIRKNMYNTGIIPWENHKAFIESLKERTDRFYWQVSTRDAVCGSVNLVDVDYELGRAELGYFMAADQMGGGKGFYFIFSALEFAFDVLELESLYGATNVENRSATLLDEYFGFKKTGEKTLVIDGVLTHFTEHILTKEDFEKDKIEKLDIEKLLLFMKKYKKANKNV